MIEIKISKEMRQCLNDTAYINQQVTEVYRKYMSEVAKRLDLEITSESFTQGTVKTTGDCNDKPSI